MNEKPRPPGKPGPGKQPEHPAERGAPPGSPQRAGKHFEIRKGKSGSVEKQDEEEPIMNVSLPRSITQEQEQADLKARLGRDELVDIDKKSSLVKVKDSVAADAVGAGRRSSGMWLLVVVVVLAGGFIAAAKLHLLDRFKQQQGK